MVKLCVPNYNIVIQKKKEFTFLSIEHPNLTKIVSTHWATASLGGKVTNLIDLIKIDYLVKLPLTYTIKSMLVWDNSNNKTLKTVCSQHLYITKTSYHKKEK